MKRLNLPVIALGAIGAVCAVEWLAGHSTTRGLASSPWPWVASAALIALLARRSRAGLIVAISLIFAARTASGIAQFDRAQCCASEERRLTGWVVGPVARTATSVRFSVESGGRSLLVVANGDESVMPGDRVSLWGRHSHGPTYRSPGVFHGGDRALRAGGHSGLFFVAKGHLAVTDARGSLWRVAARMQSSSSEHIAARGGDASGNAVVRALATGDRRAIHGDLSATLRRAGVAHLLAVSGLHLAVVSMFVFLVVRRLWLLAARHASPIEAQTAAAIISLACTALYAMVTGARPSALRALLVATVILVGLASFRRGRALDALGAAAVALIAHRPAIIFDPSLQMSLAAATVLALAFEKRVPGNRRLGRLGRLGRAALDLALVAVLALVATAPFSIPLYGELALVGVPLNVVAVPLVELGVLPLALVGSAVSAMSPAVGGPLLDLSIGLAAVVVKLAALLSDAASPVAVSSLSPAQLALTLLLLAAMVMALRRRSRSWLAVSLALAIACALSLYAAQNRDAPGRLVVTFLDVGQGDAAVIELPTGEVWLVDAGGRPGARDRRRGESPGARSVVPFLRHQGIRRIDVAIISHAHPDHYLGFGAVGGSVPITRVFVARDDPDQPRPASLRALLRWLRVNGTIVEVPPKNVTIADVSVEFLAPIYRDGVAVDPVSSVNDNSIALRIDYAGRSLLFAGDLEDEGETLLSRRGDIDLDVDVAKVNHHGSKTSSGQEWIAATSPTYAVISCGRRNRFGFPADEVVARWLASGARLLRTDLGGAVTIEVSPGGDIDVKTVVTLPPQPGR